MLVAETNKTKHLLMQGDSSGYGKFIRCDSLPCFLCRTGWDSGIIGLEGNSAHGDGSSPALPKTSPISAPAGEAGLQHQGQPQHHYQQRISYSLVKLS